MIQWDHGVVSLKHRPWNITAPTPNAIATYLCWAQFSLRFWHFWWVSSLFQWLPTISKPVLSISLIVGRLYIRISLTTRENTLVARDGEGFMEVAMLLHVLMFWPGDYLRGRRVAGIGQRKITQCAHRELWERPVLPGAALRRNCWHWKLIKCSKQRQMQWVTKMSSQWWDLRFRVRLTEQERGLQRTLGNRGGCSSYRQTSNICRTIVSKKLSTTQM